jgi:hypothetical protein
MTHLTYKRENVSKENFHFIFIHRRSDPARKITLIFGIVGLLAHSINFSTLDVVKYPNVQNLRRDHLRPI